MHERELQVAYEVALHLETMLTDAETGKHDIIFDFDVNTQGVPFVTVTTDSAEGVQTLSRIFGDSAIYKDHSGVTLDVPIIVKDQKPRCMLN